jgi:hypothetical protein
MKMRKMILAIVVFVALAGCMSTAASSSDWVGRPSTDLLADWGTPLQTVDMAGSGQVWIYYVAGLGQRIDPDTQPEAIVTKYEFVIDKDGVIKALSKHTGRGRF